MKSSLISKVSYSISGFPISATIFSWNSTNSFIASCPNIKASNIKSSLTSFAPASTMLIASLVPATVRSIVDSSNCFGVGLIINSPFTHPTFTPAIGPSNGISLIDVQRLEPNIAVNSGELSVSTDKTVFTICTSFLNPSLNKGLIGLSINLAASVAASVGRPSLFINPPGILPTEYNLS